MWGKQYKDTMIVARVCRLLERLLPALSPVVEQIAITVENCSKHIGRADAGFDDARRKPTGCAFFKVFHST